MKPPPPATVPPSAPAAAPSQKAARQAKLAKALKANLKRRKAAGKQDG